MVEAVEVAGMCPMKEYIWRHQATIAEYNVNHPIYELCVGEERMPVSRRFIQ